MDITLRDVTKHNFDAVCKLHIPDEQQKHLAPNVYSLAEAHYEGDQVRAIYLADDLEGFMMFGHETEGKIGIWRFMVAYEHQRKGIGRKSLKLAINEISAMHGIREIEICYSPTNEVAKSLYASVGFHETGVSEVCDDMLAVIKLDSGR